MPEDDTGQAAPNAQADIKARGPDFTVGFDVPRTWATGVQVFVTPAVTTMVFREQILLDEDGEMKGLLRNVGSVVMPTEVAREFSTILSANLGALNGNDQD